MFTKTISHVSMIRHYSWWLKSWGFCNFYIEHKRFRKYIFFGQYKIRYRYVASFTHWYNYDIFNEHEYGHWVDYNIAISECVNRIKEIQKESVEDYDTDKNI